MKIATIISYCTHDYRFIGKCIEEAKKFSDQILIPVCDRFYNGTLENRFLLERTYSEHRDCQFVEFSYDANQLYTPYLSYTKKDAEWANLWHATARYIGFLHIDPLVEYILFLDCDEIVEGERFASWLQTQEHEKFNAMRLGCYYYILRCNWRATLQQELTLLARKKAFHSFHFIQPGERYALFQSIVNPKACTIMEKPFIHHYSWVRPLEENLHKAATWGHQKSCDWNTIIHDSFNGKKLQEFFGVNFEFEEIQNPYFDPLSIQVPVGDVQHLSFDHVKKVDRRSILKMELESIKSS